MMSRDINVAEVLFYISLFQARLESLQRENKTWLPEAELPSNNVSYWVV